MHFLTRLISRNTKSSNDSRNRRAAGRRNSSMVLETLEGRGLMSVAGVALSYGNLSITAPLSSHNVAAVSIDPANHDVKVSVNGQSEEFSASLVTSITYIGSYGGGDTFQDNTSLTSLAYAYGSGNTFTGGTGYNYFYFYYGNNSYTAQSGSFSDVYEIGGTETITNTSKARIQTFLYS
jgi:hypothetical protein